MLRFDGWANREIARALVGASPAPDGTIRLLAHVVAAEWLWLRRLGYAAPDMAVWPELDLTRIEEELVRLDSAWRDAMIDLPARIGTAIDYTNSKGERWSSRVEDVIVHVTTHGAHHRGQIVAAFRRAGLEPPYVDFIEAARRGWLDQSA